MASSCACGQSFKEAAPWSNADCFIVVTGASRGLGRALCIQLCKELAELRNAHCPPAQTLTFFLLGRDKSALCETESQVNFLSFMPIQTVKFLNYTESAISKFFN